MSGHRDAAPAVGVDDLRLDDVAVDEHFHVSQARPFIYGREGDRLGAPQRAVGGQWAGDVARLRVLAGVEADFAAEDAVFPLSAVSVQLLLLLPFGSQVALTSQ